MRGNRTIKDRAIEALMVLTVATALVSCNRKTVYYHYEHTPIEGWEKNDTLTFNVSPMAVAGDYREHIGLRINGSYPFIVSTAV